VTFYDLQDEMRDNTYDKLRQLKAQITRPYDTPQRRHHVDIDEPDTLDGEEQSLYELMRQRTRQKARLIEQIEDGAGTCLTDSEEVMRVFTYYMDAKFAMKQTDPEAIQAILREIHEYTHRSSCRPGKTNYYGRTAGRRKTGQTLKSPWDRWNIQCIFFWTRGK
jgi:hypothetical protein